MREAVIMGIIAYLIGAIPTGFLVGRYWKKINIQREGSGNIGTANVLKVMGPGPGLVVFAGDVGKGLLVLALARQFGLSPGLELWMGFLAVMGHIFPLYLRFKGGKGLATALGVALWKVPPTVLLFLLVWAVVYLLTRHVATSSFVAMLGVAVYTGLHGIWAGIFITLLIAGRHAPETWSFVKQRFCPS